MKRNPGESRQSTRAFLACGYVIQLAIQPHIAVEARSWWSIEIPALDAIRNDDPLYAPSSALLMEDNSFMFGSWLGLTEDITDSSSETFNHLTIGLPPINSTQTLDNEPSYQAVTHAPTSVSTKVPTTSPSATVYGKISEDNKPAEQHYPAMASCPPNHTLYLLWLYDLPGDGWGESTTLSINETLPTSGSNDIIFVGSLDASNRVVTYEAGDRHRGLDVTRRESSAQSFADTRPDESTNHANSVNDKGDESERIIKNQTSSNAHYICLKTEACYSAEVSDDASPEDIHWEITRVKFLGTEMIIGSVVAMGEGEGVCTFGVEDGCEKTCAGTDQSMESTASPMTQIPTGAPVGTPEAPTFAPTSEVLRKRPSTPEYAFNYNNTASAGVSEYVRIRDVIVSASPSSTMAIANENSTQSRALDWLYVSDPSGLSDLRLVQRWVLASFYYATDGDRWVINQGWMQPGEECDWYGVTCHNGMIGRLELIQNRLIGDIVPEISTLKSMYLLSLGNDFDASEEDKNQFIIPLPSFLGDMTNLALLNLAGVGLTSTIPEELFTSWAQLESLFLNDNDITGTLPKSIEHLRSIEVLWLGGNNLGGSIVSEIGQLASLRELSLESNFRANVIGKRGFITNIPAEIGQLTSLETLNLADNALSGLVPMALGNLVSLRGLQLSGNFFEGQLPPTLGRLEMLEELDISFNWLSSTIPPDWGNMISLNSLSLASNYNDEDGYITGGIIGTLPSELGKMKNIQAIDLSNNLITGTLVTEIGLLTRLQSLYIQNNLLTGFLPPEYSNCASLKELVLQDNDLNNTIGMPDEICRLPELVLARVDCDIFCECCLSLC